MKLLFAVLIVALAVPFAPEAMQVAKPYVREYKQWVKSVKLPDVKLSEQVPAHDKTKEDNVST